MSSPAWGKESSSIWSLTFVVGPANISRGKKAPQQMGYKGQHQLGMFYINQNCALRGRGEMRTLRTSSPAVKEGKKEKKELLEAVFPFTPALVCMPLAWWDGSSDAALLPWVPWFVSSFLQLLQVCWKLPHQRNNCGFRGHSINGTGVGEMGISKTTLTLCPEKHRIIQVGKEL